MQSGSAFWLCDALLIVELLLAIRLFHRVFVLLLELYEGIRRKACQIFQTPRQTIILPHQGARARLAINPFGDKRPEGQECLHAA